MLSSAAGAYPSTRTSTVRTPPSPSGTTVAALAFTMPGRARVRASTWRSATTRAVSPKRATARSVVRSRTDFGSENPTFTDVSRCNARTNRPAVTTHTSENASCNDTTADRARVLECANDCFTGPRADAGEEVTARRAGSHAHTIVTVTTEPNAKSSTRTFSSIGSVIGNAPVGNSATSQLRATFAKATPTTPPVTVSIAAS